MEQEVQQSDERNNAENDEQANVEPADNEMENLLDDVNAPPLVAPVVPLEEEADVDEVDLDRNNVLNNEEQNVYEAEINEGPLLLNNGPPLPRLIRLRDHLLNLFHGRSVPIRGDLEFGVVRNWITRRRSRMNHNDYSDDSSSDEEGNGESARDFIKDITFDKNLPTAHSYLGELEECSGVAYQDQDSFQTISLLYVHDFVLVPGQTLPLMFSRPNEVSMIRRIVAQPDKTFGVLIQKYVPYMENEGEEQSSDLFDYGCTAEIRSFMNEDSDVSSIRVVVVGRQKFKVLEKRRQVDGNFLAKVKILEDVRLPDMCASVGLQRCMDTPRSYPPSLQDNYKTKLNAIRRSAFATSWSPWVYKMYDVRFLQMQIFYELREWNLMLEEKHCPREASDFSFWVITNLPISDKKRLQLLRMGSAEQRMIYELHLLQKCTLLACSDCGQEISKRNNVFSMSASGPMAAYVNPGGVVHETLTLYKVSGIILRGRKSIEHSWFPGYAWTICECRSCGRHMGWKFSATKSSMNPQKFWGLTRSALRPQVSTSHDSDSDSSSDDITSWWGD